LQRFSLSGNFFWLVCAIRGCIAWTQDHWASDPLMTAQKYGFWSSTSFTPINFMFKGKSRKWLWIKDNLFSDQSQVSQVQRLSSLNLNLAVFPRKFKMKHVQGICKRSLVLFYFQFLFPPTQPLLPRRTSTTF